VFAENCWYESVVAHCVSRGGGSVDEVWLHPIEPHWNDGRDADRGIPRSADAATGRRILDDLRSLSAELGTEVDVTDDGLGSRSGISLVLFEATSGVPIFTGDSQRYSVARIGRFFRARCSVVVVEDISYVSGRARVVVDCGER
jgi:hypothetical protein